MKPRASADAAASAREDAGAFATPVKHKDRRLRSHAKSSAEEDAGAFATPVKPTDRVLRSNAKTAVDDQIVTPQKAPEPPRFSRGPSVVYSLRQVRRAVIGKHNAGESQPDSEKSQEDGEEDDTVKIPVGKASSGPRSADLRRIAAKAEARAAAKLPEKYEILAQFFNSLETSYRLLRLKRQICSFSNIAPKIAYLTDKRFTYKHLAQMIHLVPEAISVKKSLTLHEATSCMMPDLQITLYADAFGDSFEGKQLSGYAVLTQVFRSRLLAFSREHAEDEDIPESELPEPFTSKKPTPSLDVTEEESGPSSQPSLPVEAVDLVSQPAAASHLSQSFQSRFAQKVHLIGKIPPEDELMTPEIMATSAPNERLGNLHTRRKSLPPNILPLVKPPSCEDTPMKAVQCESLSLESAVNETPVKLLSTPARLLCPTPDIKTPKGGTPMKLLSTPARLMCPTPDPKTLKRSCSEVDDNPRLSKKRVRRPLDMPEDGPADVNATEGGASESDSDLDDAEIKFLPKDLLKSVRKIEKKAMKDRQEGVSEKKKRQKMISCLPKLFDRILFLFQSISRSVITKEELINKIIATQFDVSDRSEVEEQLILLQEVLPDWIMGKTASSGDYIYRIDKISSPEMMRQRLAEAK